MNNWIDPSNGDEWVFFACRFFNQSIPTVYTATLFPWRTAIRYFQMDVWTFTNALLLRGRPIWSICVTVAVLNVHFRSPQTHKVSFLPLLLVRRLPVEMTSSYVFRFIITDGAVGPPCLHPHSATSFGYEKTSMPNWRTLVSSSLIMAFYPLGTQRSHVCR